MADYKDLNDYEVMYLVEDNDDGARAILFDKYKPLIEKMSRQYGQMAKSCGLEIEDLIQEAYLGLDMAIRTYDVNNGVLFYTYALVTIRSKILNYIRGNSAKKHSFLNTSISLQQPTINISDMMLFELLEDKNALLPHLIVEENEFYFLLKQFMLSLNFSHSCIFELRINGFSNQDIGKLLDLSLIKINNIMYHIRIKLKLYLKSNHSI